MQQYPFEEFVTVVLAPTVDDVTAPTLAEIAAGTDITCFLTKDGLNPGLSNNNVDGSGLCNRFDSETPGSVAAKPMLKGKRFSDDDSFWDLCEWSSPIVMIVRRGVRYGTSFAASDKVEVYDGAFGQKTPSQSAANTNQTFEVPIAVEQVELDAVVAA